MPSGRDDSLVMLSAVETSRQRFLDKLGMTVIRTKTTGMTVIRRSPLFPCHVERKRRFPCRERKRWFPCRERKRWFPCHVERSRNILSEIPRQARNDSNTHKNDRNDSNTCKIIKKLLNRQFKSFFIMRYSFSPIGAEEAFFRFKTPSTTSAIKEATRNAPTKASPAYTTAFAPPEITALPCS